MNQRERVMKLPVLGKQGKPLDFRGPAEMEAWERINRRNVVPIRPTRRQRNGE